MLRFTEDREQQIKHELEVTLGLKCKDYWISVTF